MTVSASETTGRCDDCGYDLRGLGRDGRCPECGLVIRPPSPRTMLYWPAALRHALLVAVGGLLLTLVGRLGCIVTVFVFAPAAARWSLALCVVGDAASLGGLALVATRGRRSPVAARLGVGRALFLAAGADLVWTLGFVLLAGSGPIPPASLWLLAGVALVAAATGLAWGDLLARLAAADVRYDLAENVATLHRLRVGGEGVLLLFGMILAALGDALGVMIPLLFGLGCFALVALALYALLLAACATTAARVCRSLLRPTYGRQ